MTAEYVLLIVFTISVQMTGSADNWELIAAEVRALRAELADIKRNTSDTSRNTRRGADLIEVVTDGGNAMRTVAACWELAHTILEEVRAGTRPIPTVEAFLAEMPGLVLP